MTAAPSMVSEFWLMPISPDASEIVLQLSAAKVIVSPSAAAATTERNVPGLPSSRHEVTVPAIALAEPASAKADATQAAIGRGASSAKLDVVTVVNGISPL